MIEEPEEPAEGFVVLVFNGQNIRITLLGIALFFFLFACL